MKKNVGTLDSVIRLVVAATIAILIYLRVLTGTLGLILGIIDLILLLTVFFNFSPIYALFKINTLPKEKKE